MIQGQLNRHDTGILKNGMENLYISSKILYRKDVNSVKEHQVFFKTARRHIFLLK